MAEQKYWFKAHKYGYGWSPNTWQGWLTMLLYIAAVVYIFISVDKPSHSVSNTLINFFPRLLFLSAALICVTYLKGEPVRWRWGDKKNTPEDHTRIRNKEL